MGITTQPRRAGGTAPPSLHVDSTIRLRLLGGFRLTRDGTSIEAAQSAQRLIVFLALHDHPRLRTHVAGSLWPESSDEHAGANLRSALWRVHRLGQDLIGSNRSHMWLSPRVRVDAWDVAAQAHRLSDLSWECEPWDLDVGGLLDDLLPDWYEDWIGAERERMRQLRLHALEALCERMILAGRFGHAVEAGLAAVEAEPLRESARRQLIRAHLAEGNVAEAVRQYRAYRQLLWKELRICPSRQIEDLISSPQWAGSSS